MANVFKGRRARTLKPRVCELSNADFPSVDRNLEDIANELLQLQWTILDKNKAKNLNSSLSDTDYVQKHEVLDLKRTNDGISFEIKPHITASVKFRTASKVLNLAQPAPTREPMPKPKPNKLTHAHPDDEKLCR